MKTYWFLLGWLLLALLPPLLFVNQAVRYYLVPATVPTSIALAWFVYAIFQKQAPRFAHKVLIVFVAVCCLNGYLFVKSRMDLGMNEPRRRDGLNHFVTKALLAREVHDELLRRYPRPPHHSIVGLPSAGTFHGTSGLQTWYADSTIYCQPLSW